MRLAPLVVILLILAGPAAAAPLPPALQAELLSLYQRYGAEMKAGRLQAGLALRDAKTRAEAARETRTPAGREDYLQMAQETWPDSLEVVHGQLNKSGDAASVLAVITKATAEAPSGRLRAGLTLRFVREAGAWRLADQMFGPDPAAARACPDERNEAAGAYDGERQVSVGGQITRVAFNPDHTLVVVRVIDEPGCLFLPPRAELARAGVTADSLVAFAVVSAEGRPHKTDSHKVLVSHAAVTPEDEP